MKNTLTLVIICLLVQLGSTAYGKNNHLVASSFVDLLVPPPGDCDSMNALFEQSYNAAPFGEQVDFYNLSSNYYSSEWYLNDSLVATTTNWSFVFPSIMPYTIKLVVWNEDMTCFREYSNDHHVLLPLPSDTTGFEVLGGDCPNQYCNIIDFDANPCVSHVSINTPLTNNVTDVLDCWQSAVGTADFVCDSQDAFALLIPPNPNAPTAPVFCTTSNPALNPGALRMGFHNPYQDHGGPFANNANLNFGNTYFGEAVRTNVDLSAGQTYIISYYRAFTRGMPAGSGLADCFNQIATDYYNTAQVSSCLMFCNGDEANFGNSLTNAMLNAQYNNFQLALLNPGDRLIIQQPGINDTEWRQIIEVITPSIAYDRLVVYAQHNLVSNFFIDGSNIWQQYGWYFFDQLEIAEDNFCPPTDYTMTCNQSVTLEAGPCNITNMIYEWFLTDGNGNIVGDALATGTSFTVSPSTTSTYAVVRRIALQGEPGNNGYFVNNINLPDAVCYTTVTVINPVQPEFNINNTICRNVQYELPTTSLNGFTGTWSPAFSANVLGTTLYTFVPDDLCVSEYTILISVIDCPGCNEIEWTQISGDFDGVGYTDQQFRVVADLEIYDLVHFQDCVLAVDPNVTITVHDEALLRLWGTHIYGCDAQWEGIVVEPLGKISTHWNHTWWITTLIEDARTAIRFRPNTSIFNDTRGDIDYTTFNKNISGIIIEGYPFNNVNDVFRLNGNVYSQRLVTTNPLVWANTFDFASLNPLSNQNNAENPRINTSSYPATGILPAKNPDNTYTSYSGPILGIAALNIGNSTMGSPPVFTSLNIHGNYDLVPDFPNVFDGLSHGVFAFLSNIDVTHSVFQRGKEDIQNFGVLAASFLIPHFGRVHVDNSQPLDPSLPENTTLFYNLGTAVQVNGYSHLTVNNTTIRSNRTAINPNLGDVGIRFNSNRTAKIEILNNQIHNINRGVYCQIGQNPSFDLDLNISFNTIERGLSLAPGYTPDHGITAEGLSPNNNFIINAALPFRIDGNTINNVRQGINVQQLNGRNINIRDNQITLAWQGTLLDWNATHYGVLVRTVATPGGSNVENNAISGFSESAGNSRGIRMENSTTFNVFCNFTDNMRAGLYFFGNCSGRVRHNIMTRHRYGLWLDGGAVIGTQGNSASPSNNQWVGIWSPYSGLPPGTLSTARIKTFVSGGSNAGNSILFVNPGPVTNPIDSWASAGIGNNPYDNAPQITLTNAPVSPSACSPLLVLNNENELSEEEALLLLGGLEQSAENAIANPSLVPVELIKEHASFDYVYTDEALRDSVAVLEVFYSERIDENVGKLREMEEKLEEHDVLNAEALANQVIVENTIEQASKEVLGLRLKYEKEMFTASDSLDLLIWATSCYYMFGKAVPMAQVLYNSIYNSSTVFHEDCPENLPKSAELFPSAEKEMVLDLYPNPNSEILYVNCEDESIRTADIVIRDIDGNLLYEGQIHFSRGLDLSKLSLSAGVYVVELIYELNGNITSQNKKLVYLK